MSSGKVLSGLAVLVCLLIFLGCRRDSEKKEDSFRLAYWVLQTSSPLGQPSLCGDLLAAGNQAGEVLLFTLEGKALPPISLSKAAITSPVACQDGHWFAGDEDGTLFCFQQDGKVLWSFATEGKLSGAMIFYQGLVIFGSYDQNLYALELTSGKERWRLATSGFINGAPVSEPGQDWLMLGNCDGFIRKIRASDGTLLGELDLGSPIPASPVVQDGHCYLLTHGGDLFCLQIEDLKIAWSIEAGRDFTSSPLLVGDDVLVTSGSGVVHIHNKATGRQIKTLENDQRMTPLFGLAPDLAAGLSVRGRLYLYPANKGYQLQLLHDFQRDFDQSPIPAADGFVFVDDNGAIGHASVK